MPLDDLFEGGALGEGLVLTMAAIAGKFFSGAWAESITGEEPSDGFASRYYWGAFLRVGCAMIGRGELGFLLVTTSLEDGIINRRAYSATIWALILATLLGPFAFRLSGKATSLQRPAARTTATTSQAAASTRHALPIRVLVIEGVHPSLDATWSPKRRSAPFPPLLHTACGGL